MLEQLYADYIILRYGGLSKEQALAHFENEPELIKRQLFARVETLPDNCSYLAIVDLESRLDEVTQPFIKVV